MAAPTDLDNLASREDAPVHPRSDCYRFPLRGHCWPQAGTGVVGPPTHRVGLGYRPVGRAESGETTRMAACAKIPYPSLHVAEDAMRAIRRRSAGLGRRVPTGVYWCAACRRWHLTSHGKSQVPHGPRDGAPRRKQGHRGWRFNIPLEPDESPVCRPRVPLPPQRIGRSVLQLTTLEPSGYGGLATSHGRLDGPQLNNASLPIVGKSPVVSTVLNAAGADAILNQSQCLELN